MPIGQDRFINPITVTSNVVSVANVDTLVIAANPRRRFLLIQRGTTVGRVFLHFDATAATVTNGILMRENAYLELAGDNLYLGELRAISVGSSKILYVTEGVTS